MFRTLDGGTSWQPITGGYRGYFQPLIARGMRFDPVAPQHLWTWGFRGLFESSDLGSSWDCLTRSLPPSPGGQPYSLSAVAIDPDDHQVIYAAHGVFSQFYGGDGDLFKSTDRGQTWQKLQTGIPEGTAILWLEIDPDSPKGMRRVYASTSSGFFLSVDGGKSWVQTGTDVFPDGCMTMTLMKDPQTQGTRLFVVAKSSCTPGDPTSWRGGVFTSSDGGKTWSARNNGLRERVPEQAGGRGFSQYFHIAHAGKTSGILYLSGMGNSGTVLHKSTDWGETWTHVTQDNIDPGWGWAGVDGFYVSATPENHQVAYAGVRGSVIKTEDGGESWRQLTSFQQTNELWKGTGLEVTFVNQILEDPFDENRVYVAMNDVGLLISPDKGDSYNMQPPCGLRGDAYSIVADPDVPGLFYVGYGIVWGEPYRKNDGMIIKTTDHGETWEIVGSEKSGLVYPSLETRQKYRTTIRFKPKFRGIASLALGPKNARGKRPLYAAVQLGGIFQSLDGGASWSKVSKDFDTNVYVLKSHPKKRGVLYAGVYDLVEEEGGTVIPGGLFKSSDGGRTWKKIKSIPDVSVTSISIAPTRPNTLYVGCEERTAGTQDDLGEKGGVYRSVDGGETWCRVLAEPQCQALEIDPNNADTVIACSSTERDRTLTAFPGVYRTIDGGKSWRRHNEGISNFQLKSVTISPSDPKTIYIGTHSGALFRSRQ